MIGELVYVENIHGNLTVLSIEEIDSKNIVRVTVESDKDYSKYLRKLLTINTTVTPIANANMNYTYPEGTVGN